MLKTIGFISLGYLSGSILYARIFARLFKKDNMIENSKDKNPGTANAFMYGGFWHLFFNMFALYTFGSPVERTIGTKKFLILYFVAGFGAAAMHFGVMNLQLATLEAKMAEGSSAALQTYATLKSIPTVGASGAIYGLLISYALLYPQSRLTLIFPPITLSAKTWVIIFALIELFTGIHGLDDGVAHFAHLGGMLFGWLLILYWRKRKTLFDDYMRR